MRNLSKNPSNWKIWNPPLSKSINYSSIYDKRRDFQRLIRKMKIEGPNTCEMSSCCIFDYNLSCSFKIQKKIDAIFFDESENFNCLLLELVLDEQFLKRKSNSLMIFLKKSRNCKIFELHNSTIYVSCKEEFKWPVFYYLFEFLLQKPCKTIIGVKFYTHFVYRSLIVSELTFLHIYSFNYDTTKLEVHYKKMESKKVINSKSAKISSAGDSDATEAFNTNLPSKRKINTDFQELSESEKVINSKSAKISSAGDSDATETFYTNLPSKRKINTDFQELSKGEQVFLKSCKCKETKWQHFKPILKYAHNDYKHILEAKGILIKSTLDSPLNLGKLKPSESSTKNSAVDIAKGASLKRKLPEEYTEKYMECTIEKLKSPKLSNKSKIEQVEQKLKSLNQDFENTFKEVKNSSMVVLSEKNIQKIRETDEISLKRKLSGGCTEKTSTLILAKENDRHLSINKTLISGANELKTNESVAKNSFMNFKSTFSSVSTIHGEKLEDSSKPFVNNREIPTFQTASGKSLVISDKARRIAEKIYTEVCSQSTESDKQEEIKNFSDISSNKDFNDDELDTFFKDVCNETDYQCSSSSTLGNITPSYQQGKSRKSLGGRRSLKPYSHKA